MNPAAILLGIAVTVVVAGIAVAATRKPWLLPNDRVWILGDSLGVGLLPKFDELGVANQIPVAGNPIGGTIIRQWAQKDLSAIRDWGATIVLVVLGSNDANANEDYVRDQAPGYARGLVHKLQAMGLKVWWLAPGETGALKYSAEVRSMIEALAFSEGIRVEAVPDSIPYSPYDNIHPTPAGYQQLAEWIWDRWVTRS